MRSETSGVYPLLAAMLASAFFGASVVATRFVVEQATPEMIAFFRYAIGALCLVPFLLHRNRPRIPWRDLAPIFVLGVVFFGLFPWTFSAALRYIPASHGAVVLATMPMLTLGLAALVGYEVINRNKLLGVGLTLGGVVLAIGGGQPVSLGPSSWGYLLMLATAVLGALFNVFSRPYLKRHHSLQVTAFCVLAGALFLTPGAAWQMQSAGWPQLTPAGWAAIVFVGTAAGAIGFYLWIWALQRTTPTRVAVFVTLNPMVATALGALLLDEQITSGFALGLAGVAAGIILANRPVEPVNSRPLVSSEQPS